MKSNLRNTLAWFCFAVLYGVTSKFIDQTRSAIVNPEMYCDSRNCEQGCFNKNPTDCFGYIVCSINVKGMYAFKMPCPFGLVFDPEIDSCNYIEEVYKGCENDPCFKDKSLKTHQSGLTNCVQYYRCEISESTQMRYSAPQCCAHGEKFVNGTCVQNNDPSCEWECPDIYAPAENYTTTTPAANTTDMEVAKVCPKQEQEGSKGMEYLDENGVLRRCAKGTIFNKTDCGCITDPNFVHVMGCEFEVILKFSRSGQVWSVPNSGSQNAWVGATELTESNDRGDFKPSTNVYIPIYLRNTNIASHFTLQFVFKDLSTADNNQTLVSNCKSRDRELPPFAILMDNVKGIIHFVADSDTRVSKRNVHVSLPYDKTKENYVYYSYDGYNITAIVKPLNVEHTNEKLSEYKINVLDNQKGSATIGTDGRLKLPVGLGPLTIGSCSLGKFQSGFTGYLKQFEVTSNKGGC